MTIQKTTTDLSTLKINYLTQEMYDEALENNEINANELYLTPGSGGGAVTDVRINGTSVVTNGVANVELGYEVEDTTETLINPQTVFCNTSSLGGSYQGTINGDFNFVDYPSITVELEGYIFVCPYNSSDNSYGAVYSEGQWSSDYPFQICHISQVLSLLIFSDSAVTYSIKITAGDVTVTTTSDFDNAVKHSRGIHISSSTPTSSDGEDGDLWLTY